MDIVDIEKLEGTVVHVHGAGQGYRALPARHTFIVDTAQMIPAHSITTAWKPTPEELEALNSGAPVYVETLHLDLPAPMLVTVGPIPK